MTAISIVRTVWLLQREMFISLFIIDVVAIFDVLQSVSIRMQYTFTVIYFESKLLAYCDMLWEAIQDFLTSEYFLMEKLLAYSGYTLFDEAVYKAKHSPPVLSLGFIIKNLPIAFIINL